MHFSAQSLDSLRSSLANNPALSSHIQTFIRLGVIFTTLSNLKRLYIAPSQSDTTTPLQPLPSSVGITHLSTDSYWDYQDVLHFLERPNQRRAIQYLRILEDHHPRFRPIPPPSGNFVNLHTVDGYPRLWYTFVKNGAPIEHLAAQFADFIDFIDPALVFREIRTLQISSWNQGALSEPLPHLKSIELLYVTLTMCDAKIPLEDLFSIPSAELKYLRIDSSDDHEHYAQKLLDHFPSLVLLDFKRLNPSEPSRRYTRRQTDVLGETKVICETLPSACFGVYHPAFTSWWELFREDFEKVGLVFQPLKREVI
ncbi:hypothetical protein ONZ45_g17376 [Pleurotus djamor]|nr:hypothetical protein ONZ45_g17376 [Pleurotus djamor]